MNDGFLGFTIGGNAAKKMKVSEDTQKRLEKIFADSDRCDNDKLNRKLEELEEQDIFGKN